MTVEITSETINNFSCFTRQRTLGSRGWQPQYFVVTRLHVGMCWWCSVPVVQLCSKVIIARRVWTEQPNSSDQTQWPAQQAWIHLHWLKGMMSSYRTLKRSYIGFFKLLVEIAYKIYRYSWFSFTSWRKT